MTAAEYYAAHRGEVLQKHHDDYQSSRQFLVDDRDRRELCENPRRALRADAVICLECFQIVHGMLNNAHLRVHGLTAEAYKTKWGYDQDTPLVSEQVAAKLRARIRRGGLRPEDREDLSLTSKQWKVCQEDPRRAIQDDLITRGGRFIVCLECGLLFGTLGTHITTHGITADSYRAKWGYDRGTGLCSRSYSRTDSERAQRRGWGSRLQRFHFNRARVSPESGRAGGMRPGTKLRLQTRLNRREAQEGKARPAAWRQMPSGVISDARVAKLRLGGKTIEDIERLTGLSPMAIHFRLIEYYII